MSEPTVLMVEDNPADLYLVCEALRQYQVAAQVIAMSDGESAIRFIEEGTDCPDLVILDLNLPKRTGVQVLEFIRATPGYYEIPVIVFTSSLSEYDNSRIGSLGVTACILKSLDLDEFNRIGLVIKEALLNQAGPGGIMPQVT
jgi:CheY-like chemotaxis protein